MTKEQFLKDTIDYYSADLNRRCVVNKKGGINFCAYSPKSAGLEGVSEGCAIGRHLTPEAKEKLDAPTQGYNGPAGIREIMQKEGMQELFPQWMRDMNINFLSNVQALHDVTNNWETGGLSNKGKFRANNIIKGFELKMEKYEIPDDINSFDSL